ncbi:MAG TPA: amidohydrolase family protein [Beijerinckiaceae bacterium]|jgi:2,3-dihydroxybenzoate decarboxylase
MSRPFPVIAIEEHYWDHELVSHLTGAEGTRSPAMLERLYDFGGVRLAEMDAAGIDMQVLSHGAPSGQKLPADIAPKLIAGVNDRLAAAIKPYPTRFAAFAALPTAAPEAAADELERAVTELGFKGAMIHGLTNGEFHDIPKHRPLFARAAALDAPIYLHPSFPHPQVMDLYYRDYADDFPQVIRAAWGYTVETATQAIRLILSGVFEENPNLKIILGHMGETLPFVLWRVSQALSRPGHRRPIDFRATFARHFWITTSGNFSTPALRCAAEELGLDRIMFSVDWPFVENPPAMTWLDSLYMPAADKAKFAGGTAKALLKL